MAGISTTGKPVVYVVDDDSDFRDSVQSLLANRGMTAIGFGSAEAFLQTCGDGRAAGCLLLDVRMSGMSGLSLQEELARRGIAIPIIVMTAYGDVTTAVRAMKAGAADFVQKPFDVARLLASIEYALEHDQQHRAQQAWRSEAAARLATLTDREHEVLEAVVNGCSNRQIADQLDISPRTVETHRKNIMRKTATDSLPALVRLVMRAGPES